MNNLATITLVTKAALPTVPATCWLIQARRRVFLLYFNLLQRFNIFFVFKLKLLLKSKALITLGSQVATTCWTEWWPLPLHWAPAALVQQPPPPPIFHQHNLISYFHYLPGWPLWALAFAAFAVVHVGNKPNNKVKVILNLYNL